jgi:tetratricopeptide (TPR) repeat protein
LLSPLPRRVVVVLVVFLLAAQILAAPPDSIPESLAYRPHDPQNLTAFNHFYNLDYDRAVQEFEQVLARHPNDPFAVNHLLTATLFRELYLMGVLNTGEYANDTFISAPHRPADPKIKQQINDLVKRALQLEEKRLAANPNDVEALYARGVTRAQFATYTALIERAWFSALRNAVGARRDHERVLELSPSTTEAKLIVGAHNYVVGNLPWGVKAAASMVGLGGNKDKGLQYLKECSQGNGETSIDAQILLAVFLRREHRYDEALPIVRGLVPRFPQDVLLALEEGHLLRAAGRNQEAEAVYRKIWQDAKDTIPACTMRSPRSAWGICGAARKTTAERHRLTNRWGRRRKLIPRLCRKPIWGRERCTICYRSVILRWPSIRRCWRRTAVRRPRRLRVSG